MKWIWIINVAAGILMASYSFASLSVWDQLKNNNGSQANVVGTIKAMTVDDEEQNATLTIRKGDNSIAIVRLCPSALTVHGGNHHQDKKFSIVKSAMTSGFKVNISYSSVFDSCAKKISVYSGKGQWVEI